MPEELGARVQVLGGPPQGRGPPLEHGMPLWPGVALPDMHLIADAPAALHLGRTHPLALQTARQASAIEERAGWLNLNAPETRMSAIVGASGGRVLRRACSQVDAHGCLQRQREVGVFVQVA